MHVEIREGIRSVLIVEDEMIVALLMEDLIRDLGVSDVYLCVDAASALEIVRSKTIDCAVLDVRVRDGDTTQVADALAAQGTPFLFSSGGDAATLEPRHAGRPLISKPFHDDDLKLILLDTWFLARAERAPDAHIGARTATAA